MRDFKPLIRELITSKPEDYLLEKINELIEKNPLKISQLIDSLSDKSGVYVAYEGEYKPESFVYVGETDSLKRRLKGDISRGKLRYHTLLRKIVKNLLQRTGQDNEEQIKEELDRKFLFAFIETESKEIAFVIEGVLIRTYKEQLKFNKIKKYQK